MVASSFQGIIEHIGALSNCVRQTKIIKAYLFTVFVGLNTVGGGQTTVMEANRYWVQQQRGANLGTAKLRQMQCGSQVRQPTHQPYPAVAGDERNGVT